LGCDAYFGWQRKSVVSCIISLLVSMTGTGFRILDPLWQLLECKRQPLQIINGKFEVESWMESLQSIYALPTPHMVVASLITATLVVLALVRINLLEKEEHSFAKKVLSCAMCSQLVLNPLRKRDGDITV